MTPRPRYPLLAALVTPFAPGLGHLYAGKPWQAVAWSLGMQAAVVLVPFIMLSSWFTRSAALALWLLPLLVLLPTAHAWRVARRQAVPYSLHPANRWYIYLAFFALSYALSQLSVQPLLQSRLHAFRLPSGSMEPTLRTGDFLYARLAPADEVPAGHGALVLFASAEEPGLQVLKRVVATPGDTIAMRHGALFRNGDSVPEPYVQHQNPHKSEGAEYREKMRQWQRPHLIGSDTADYQPDVSDWGPLVVPPDSLFLLGDNREASYDSRYYGWVGRDHLLGSPTLIYYSFDPGSVRALPQVTAIRWERMGIRFP